MKILAVTACPSGVAHTYMAAEALKNACAAEQIECKVETQGSIGIENAITAEDLAGATAVVLTCPSRMLRGLLIFQRLSFLHQLLLSQLLQLLLRLSLSLARPH